MAAAPAHKARRVPKARHTQAAETLSRPRATSGTDPGARASIKCIHARGVASGRTLGGVADVTYTDREILVVVNIVGAIASALSLRAASRVREGRADAGVRRHA